MDFIARLIEEHQDYVLQLMKLTEAIEGIRINGRGEYFRETVDHLWKLLTVDLDDQCRQGGVPVPAPRTAGTRESSSGHAGRARGNSGPERRIRPMVSALAGRRRERLSAVVGGRSGPAREIHDPYAKGKFDSLSIGPEGSPGGGAAAISGVG